MSNLVENNGPRCRCEDKKRNENARNSLSNAFSYLSAYSCNSSDMKTHIKNIPQYYTSILGSSEDTQKYIGIISGLGDDLANLHATMIASVNAKMTELRNAYTAMCSEDSEYHTALIQQDNISAQPKDMLYGRQAYSKKK